jgi:hypothetical protein
MHDESPVVMAVRAKGFTKRKATYVANMTFRIMRDVLAAGDRIEIPGFGTFFLSYDGKPRIHWIRDRWTQVKCIRRSYIRKWRVRFKPDPNLDLGLFSDK